MLFAFLLLTDKHAEVDVTFTEMVIFFSFQRQTSICTAVFVCKVCFATDVTADFSFWSGSAILWIPMFDPTSCLQKVPLSTNFDFCWWVQIQQVLSFQKTKLQRDGFYKVLLQCLRLIWTLEAFEVLKTSLRISREYDQLVLSLKQCYTIMTSNHRGQCPMHYITCT